MIVKNEQYDVAVVGAGLSGVVAAVASGNKGLKTLLIEKGRTLGGTGNYVEGIFAVGTKYQKAENIDVSEEQILNIERDFTHDLADMHMWYDYVSQSANDVDWLEKNGVEFKGIRNLGKHGLSVWHQFEGKGKQAIASLIETAKKKNVEIVTSTEVINLFQDSDYWNVDLKEYSGEEQSIKAKNIILATGGFLNNPELIAKLTDYTPERVIAMNSGKNTGDGIKLAGQAGAQLAKAFVMSFGGSFKDDNTPAYVFRGTDLNNAVAREGVLWINQNGERFANEDTSEGWGVGGRKLARQVRTFAILDSDQVESLKSEGGPISGRKYTDLSNQIDKYVKQDAPFITKADSIEELAQKLSLNSLVETVEEYNQACEAKKDIIFGKNPELLHSVKVGPFYAIEIGDGAFCTAGGIRVDRKNHVLDKKGHEIKGLYAIGNDGAWNIFADSYDVKVAGAEAGYCIYSGINAIKNL